jgi:hypothetical protein
MSVPVIYKGLAIGSREEAATEMMLPLSRRRQHKVHAINFKTTKAARRRRAADGADPR